MKKELRVEVVSGKQRIDLRLWVRTALREILILNGIQVRSDAAVEPEPLKRAS